MERLVKVLIADDEILVRIGIIHALDWKQNGFEIVGEAADGENCIRMAQKLQPDLIILDINMPGMNGIQTLQELKEIGYPGKVIMLTCYDEFKYVREAMRGGANDYVLKAGMDANSLLDAAKRLEYADGDRLAALSEDNRLRQEQLLRQYIAGYSFGGENSLGFRENDFSALVCRIQNIEDIERRKDQRGMEVFYRSLSSILVQTLQSYQEYTAFLYDRETIAVFASFSAVPSIAEKQLRIRTMTEHIRTTLRNYLDVNLVLGVSGFCTGRKEIRKSFEQAMLMLGRTFTEKGNIFYFNEFREYYDRQSSILQELSAMETELRKSVADGYLNAIWEGLQAYFEKVRMGRIITAERVTMFCTDLVKLIQAKRKDWREQAVLERMEKCETLEEVESCVYAWIDRILPERTDEVGNYLVRRACTYIREHYWEDITLSGIAGFLKLSESYTSRIFNREMGMNIPAYVNQIRLERAKELLLHSDLKIYEIVQKTGYLSTTAFHVAFKKQENMTPAEWRNLHAIK